MNIGQLTATLGITTQGMSAANVAISQFANNANARLNTVQNSLAATAGKMQSFGRAASMYMTVPITLAGRASLNAAKDFEFSMQKIVGLVGESQDQVNSWSKDILELGPKLGRSPKELADALYFVTSSGYSGAEALDIVTQSAKAASSGLGDTKVIADLVTSALAAYSNTALSTTEVLDILTAAVREGKGEASDFAKQLGDVIPIASKMGVSFDQVAGAVSAVTLTGQSVSEVVTGLRQVLFEIQKPSVGAAKALGKMGSSFDSIRNSIREKGLLETLSDLNTLTNKYGVESLSKILPNIRAYNNFLSLMGDRYEENIALQKNVSDSSGSLQKAFGSVADTLEFRYNQAVSGVQAELINLGLSMKESIIPLMDSFVKTLSRVIKWYTSLSTGTQQFILKTALLLAVLGPVTLSISILIKTFAGFTSILAVATRAISVFTGFMATNPVTAFILVLGILATTMYAVYKASNTAKKAQQDYNDELERGKALRTEDRSIEEQMKALGTLNATQLSSLKSRIEAELKATDDYQATMLGKVKSWNAMRLKENTDDSAKQIQIQGYVSKSFAQTQIEKYKEEQKGNDKSVKLLNEYLNVVNAKLRKTGGSKETTITFNMDDSIEKIMLSVATSEKAIAIESDALGQSFDVTSEKTNIYKNALENLLKIKGISITNKSIQGIIGKLQDLDFTSAESEKRITKLANELLYLDKKAKIVGPSFDLASEQLQTYNNSLEDAMKSGTATADEMNVLQEHVKQLTKEVILNDKTLQHQLATLAYENSVLSEGWDVTEAEKSYNKINKELQAYIAEMQRLESIKINADGVVDPEIETKLTDATEKVKDFQTQLNAISAKQYMVENLSNAFSTVSSALGNVSTAAELMGGSLGSAFESIVQWISLIGSSISSVQEIVKMVNSFTLASQAQAAVGSTQAVANAAVATSATAAIAPTAALTLTTTGLSLAYKEAAVSGALAASSWVPFPGNIAAMTSSIATLLSSLTAGMAGAAATSIPGLAEGGVIPGGYPNDTYPAMLSSGELVVPPGKLENIASKANNTNALGDVKFRIEGYDLIGVIQKQTRKNKVL
jgi:TP901 family phage tail tape measure protein